MSEREELRDRVARELRRMAAEAWHDEPDALLKKYPWDHAAASYWLPRADRILADPEIARWRQIAEQEPVAWMRIASLGIGPTLRSLYEHRPTDERYKPGAMVVWVPLVPLTTEPGEK